MPVLFPFLKLSLVFVAQRQLARTSQSVSNSFLLGHLKRELHSAFPKENFVTTPAGALKSDATAGLQGTWNGFPNSLRAGGAQKLLHKQAFQGAQKLVDRGGTTSPAIIKKLKTLFQLFKKASPISHLQISTALSTRLAGLLRTNSPVGLLRKRFFAQYGQRQSQGGYQSMRVFQQLQGAGKLLAFQKRIVGSLARLRQQVSLFRGGTSRQGYSRQDPNTILYGLIGANVLVWLLWSQPKLQAFMHQHFLASVDAIANGRLHTIITANFSHTDGSHILLNMISLYFFGQSVGYQYGGKALLGLYMAGGVGCMAGYCLYWTYFVPWREGLNPQLYNPRRTPPCQGASGSVMAIMMLSILTDPFRTVYVNLFIPVPALLFGAFVVYSDLSGAIGRDYSSRVGYSGHLGGAAVGAAAWAYLRHLRFR